MLTTMSIVLEQYQILLQGFSKRNDGGREGDLGTRELQHSSTTLILDTRRGVLGVNIH